jgi:hypothetical protein
VTGYAPLVEGTHGAVAHLFVIRARAPRLPAAWNEEEFLLLASGDDAEDAGPVVDEANLVYLIVFLAVAASYAEAEARIRLDAWPGDHADALELEGERCEVARLTRAYRRRVRAVDRGDVARAGMPIAIPRTSADARARAVRIVDHAMFRRRWQFWR